MSGIEYTYNKKNIPDLEASFIFLVIIFFIYIGLYILFFGLQCIGLQIFPSIIIPISIYGSIIFYSLAAIICIIYKRNIRYIILCLWFNGLVNVLFFFSSRTDTLYYGITYSYRNPPEYIFYNGIIEVRDYILPPYYRYYRFFNEIIEAYDSFHLHISNIHDIIIALVHIIITIYFTYYLLTSEYVKYSFKHKP